MHRSDCITKGSTIAFVGQFLIQISHFPQSDSQKIKKYWQMDQPKNS